MAQIKNASQPLVTLTGGQLNLAGRELWRNLELTIQKCDFVAILGPNGAGKSSFLRVLLGTQPLTAGNLQLFGRPPERGNKLVGYVPQQKQYDPTLPLRGRDLVAFGLDGFRYGLHRRSAADKRRLDMVIDQVGATNYADSPLGTLSGGEQQRLRIAQALVSRPKLMLCDEPLLSLDIPSQQVVTALLDDYRRNQAGAVLFVTHEINPVLPYVTKILYLANGRWVLDTPDKVLTASVLSGLYGSRIEVLRVHGRVLVIGAEDSGYTLPGTIEAGHHV